MQNKSSMDNSRIQRPEVPTFEELFMKFQPEPETGYCEPHKEAFNCFYPNCHDFLKEGAHFPSGHINQYMV